MVAFCQAIQFASPINSHVTPYPAYMPGYEDDVIMAAGTFIQGASIELTADGPTRPPYVAYVQGGLTYSHVKVAICIALNSLLEKELLSLQ
jgi:cystathionine beta-lyase family protein involved in aluminum resistance